MAISVTVADGLGRDKNEGSETCYEAIIVL